MAIETSTFPHGCLMNYLNQLEENYLARGFRDVDAADSAKLAQCRGFLDSLPSFRRYKDSILEAIGSKPREITADLGCGLGFDVRRLAGLVGPGGCAIGVDSSKTFLDSARSMSQSSAVVKFYANRTPNVSVIR